MTTTLGSIVLDDEWVLRGLEADRVAAEVARSDSGAAQILLAAVDGGRSLELHGYLTVDQEEQVLALSAGMGPVSLVHHRFSGSVLITGTSFDYVDNIEYANPLPTTERVGSIYLLEV